MTDFGEESTGRVQHDHLESHMGLLPTYRVAVTTDIGDIVVDRDIEQVLREMWERVSALETGP